MKDLADLGSHSRNAAKVFAFLRNPVWALQIGATIVTSVQSGLLSARASRALRQLWCDATWWYQKDYEKYRKMILEIRRNWKCKKNCLEESQTTKLNKHDVWTKVVLDISDLLDVVCFCCIWDLDKSIFGEKNRKHVDKQNDAVCGSSHAEIRILYTPWAMQPEEQCVRAWSLFKKQEIETCWITVFIIWIYVSTILHLRTWKKMRLLRQDITDATGRTGSFGILLARVETLLSFVP